MTICTRNYMLQFVYMLYITVYDDAVHVMWQSTCVQSHYIVSLVLKIAIVLKIAQYPIYNYQ